MFYEKFHCSKVPEWHTELAEVLAEGPAHNHLPTRGILRPFRL